MKLVTVSKGPINVIMNFSQNLKLLTINKSRNLPVKQAGKLRMTTIHKLAFDTALNVSE